MTVMPREEGGVVTVLTPGGDRLKVPQWMLSPAAACAPVGVQAALSRSALLALAELIQLGSRAPTHCRLDVDCTDSVSKTGCGPRKERNGADSTRPGMDAAGGTLDPSRRSSRRARKTHGRRHRRGERTSEGGRR